MTDDDSRDRDRLISKRESLQGVHKAFQFVGRISDKGPANEIAVELCANESSPLRTAFEILPIVSSKEMLPCKIYRKSLTKYFSASFAYWPSNEIGRKRWGPRGVTSRVHSADHDSTATVFPVPSINDEQLGL